MRKSAVVSLLAISVLLVYIQRQPPSPQGPPEPEASWYYCQSAKGHYPYLQTCPEAWVNVPARPE
jgi:hypothetical protein